MPDSETLRTEKTSEQGSNGRLQRRLMILRPSADGVPVTGSVASTSSIRENNASTFWNEAPIDASYPAFTMAKNDRTVVLAD
jgi:hypothetical protein